MAAAASTGVSRSLHQLLLESDLRERIASSDGGVVTAGWLQSGEWKTARALAAYHDLVVIDAEHGAITLDQVRRPPPAAAAQYQWQRHSRVKRRH